MSFRFFKVLALMFLFMCTSCQPDGEGKDVVSAANTETRHVVVDDEIIANGDVYEIIDPVWWTVNIYDGVDAYESSLSAFSKPQRLVSAVIWYQSEVNNGGHDQFYYNSTGIVWRDALEAFRTVGLRRFEKVLSDSADRFSRPPSLGRDERNEQMDSDAPEFDDLDSRFYALEDSVNLDAKLLAYIKRNRSEFHFDGNVNLPQ